MEKTKKSKSDTIEKLRLILDNPCDNSIDSNQNRKLNELKERLIKYYGAKICYQSDPNLKSDSLKPSVIIHKNKVFEEKREEEIPEFKTIETITQFQKPDETLEILKDQELYEIEKLEEKIPEFQELKEEIPKKDKKVVEKQELVQFELVEEQDETEEKLPEWTPVTIKKEKIKPVKSEEPKKEKIISETEGWEPIEKDTIQIDESEKITKDVQFEESKIEERITTFEEFTSIDDNIAKLLYNNNIRTIGDLKKVSVKELSKIKGIKKKTAKQIKKDLSNIIKNKKPRKNKKFKKIIIEKQADEELAEWEPVEEEIITTDKGKKPTKKETEKQEKNDIYKFGEYKLYKKEIQIGDKKSRIIHFFSKTKPDDGEPTILPKGYKVKVNKKTGVPYIKREK